MNFCKVVFAVIQFVSDKHALKVDKSNGSITLHALIPDTQLVIHCLFLHCSEIHI